MTRHQEPMTTRSTALLQQIEGSVLGRYRSCLFSGHDIPPAQLTLPLPSVYHLHSQFATLVFFAWLLKSRRDRWKATVLTAQAVQKSDVPTGKFENSQRFLRVCCYPRMFPCSLTSLVRQKRYADIARLALLAE